jgi:molecular chaperone DnaJ
VPARPEHDYYALLGVQADADAEALRLAWRQLASRWHPDRAGVAATVVFQQLSAAYAVLSDPLARAAYDRRRRARAGGAGGTGSPRAAAAAPPAGPVRPAAPGVMLGRLSKPLWLLLPSGAARLDEDGSGFITLVLRPDEAAQGGMVSIPMRIDVWCPACAAAGAGAARQTAASSCVRCGGSRKVEELFSAWLAVPPGAVDGEVLTPSAELPGTVDPVRFRVEVFKGRA